MGELLVWILSDKFAQMQDLLDHLVGREAQQP
jgi:hypothetical protein